MRFSILFSLALAGVSIAAPISQASINAPIEVSFQKRERELSKKRARKAKSDSTLALSLSYSRQARAANCFSGKDALLQKVGNLVAALEKDLGVTAVEDALDKALPLVSVAETGVDRGCYRYSHFRFAYGLGMKRVSRRESNSINQPTNQSVFILPYRTLCPTTGSSRERFRSHQA